MKYFVATILLILHLPVLSQDSLVGNFPPPAIAPKVFAAEATSPMKADGILDEAVWKVAPVTSNFHRWLPRQGGKYQHQTYVQVAFDQKNLYIAAFNKDTAGKKGVRVAELRRDFIWGTTDAFFVNIDAQNTKRFCISLMVTPYGNVRDLQVFDDSYRDTNWDALFEVKTNITDSGWYAEYAIPFASLRYNAPKEGEEVIWGISFARLTRRDFEAVTFPAVPQSISIQRMTYAAELRGLKIPPPSTNLRVQPYMLYQFDKTTDANGVTRMQSVVKPGGEIKWAINSNSVLDVTFNTDFAQAEVDRAVNNLTRFNVFFPERRQFFLENSGVYAGADVPTIKPFFSRTIGLSSTEFNAAPLPIDAGVRYTNRTKDRTIAGLYVKQRATDDFGAAHFAVARYVTNFGKMSNAGVMVTHRADEGVEVKDLKGNQNTTITLDGLFRPSQKFTFAYLASASSDSSGKRKGIGANLYTSYNTNRSYIYARVTYIDSLYKPGMGFISASNTFMVTTGADYNIFPKGRWSKKIRQITAGADLFQYHDAKRLGFQNAVLYFYPFETIFNNNSSFNLTLLHFWEQYFFAPLGYKVAPGKYSYSRYRFHYNSDYSKKVSANVEFITGRYYDGQMQEVTAGLRFAPNHKIAFTVDYSLNKIRDLGIEQTDANISIYTLGTRLAASPRLQLSGFYQYNTFDKRARLNLRASWEFAPLSFVYLVYNDAETRNTLMRNQSAIAKVSYLKQF